MKDTTVIYYTSNAENEAFENKIQDKLLAQIGDMPLISVSRKPINFGLNIVVGNTYLCDANLYRQIYIACEFAKTKWVLSAESDCLYPPEYFSFIPDQSIPIYRYTNVWIMFKNRSKFMKKEYSECAQIACREYLMQRIELAMVDRPYWSDKNSPKFPQVYRKRKWGVWESENPVVNIKTGHGLRSFTGTMKSISPADELPYFGKFDRLHMEIFG